MYTLQGARVAEHRSPYTGQMSDAKNTCGAVRAASAARARVTHHGTWQSRPSADSFSTHEHYLPAEGTTNDAFPTSHHPAELHILPDKTTTCLASPRSPAISMASSKGSFIVCDGFHERSTCAGDKQGTQSSCAVMRHRPLEARHAQASCRKRCTCPVGDHREEHLELSQIVRAHLRRTSRSGIPKDLGPPRHDARQPSPSTFGEASLSSTLLPRCCVIVC